MGQSQRKEKTALQEERKRGQSWKGGSGQHTWTQEPGLQGNCPQDILTDVSRNSCTFAKVRKTCCPLADIALEQKA